MSTKKRLDLTVLEQNPELAPGYVQSIIMQGKVLVNGHPCTKAGTMVTDDDEIVVTVKPQKFVSRAGLKLEKALDHFGVDVKDLVVLDAGISTGGFTDCLLQRGAKRVYGVDVGHGQVHEKVLRNERLVLMEQTNLRLLEKLPELVDLVTLDLSFISILAVMPAISKLIKPQSKIITLIKPQFEAAREQVEKGGIVTDAAVHKEIIEKVRRGMADYGFTMVDVIESPITGAAKGNKEFLACFVR